MKKILLASGLLVSLSALQAQNRAASLDGIDDYFDCGTSASLSPTNIKTMECWVKFNNLSGDQEILSRSIGGQGLELLLIGGNLRVYAMSGANYSFLSYPASSLQTNIWYHLAFSWNGTRESMKLYVNAVSVGTRTDGGDLNASGVSNPAASFRIGQWSDPLSRPFNGAVDEVRVWNVQRTATQIKDAMLGVVPSTTAGLVAYYGFNEASGTAFNSTATAGLDGAPINGATRTGSSVGFADNALNFDGANDQVVVAANPLFDLGSGTVEFVIRPSTMGINGCIGGVRGTGGTRYSFHMNTSNNTVGMWNNTIYNTLSYPFVLGNRYHLAFVCNGSQTSVYIDGNLLGTLPSSFGTLAGQPLVFGLAKNSGGDGEPYAGDIDEVRLWTTQRTGAELYANKDISLTGKEAGLVALYNFNLGNAGGSNGWMTTVFDLSPNNLHGIASNFAMSGSTSNYVGNMLAALPVSYSRFDCAREHRGVRLEWQTAAEQHSGHFIIERSADGRFFTSIGSVAAAGQGSRYAFLDDQAPVSACYYRLRQVDADGREHLGAIRMVGALSGRISLSVTMNSGRVQLAAFGGSEEPFAISDISGRTWAAGRLKAGRAEVTLKPGIYFVSVPGAAAIRFLLP